MATLEATLLSLAVGFVFFAGCLLFAWLSLNYGISQFMGKFIYLPMLLFGIIFGINAVLHTSNCSNKANWARVAIGTAVPIGFLYLSYLATLLGFLRGPIEDAIPLRYKLRWAGPFAVAYYAFWAGVFGESIGYGTISLCE